MSEEAVAHILEWLDKPSKCASDHYLIAQTIRALRAQVEELTRELAAERQRGQMAPCVGCSRAAAEQDWGNEPPPEPTREKP